MKRIARIGDAGWKFSHKNTKTQKANNVCRGDAPVLAQRYKDRHGDLSLRAAGRAKDTAEGNDEAGVGRWARVTV